MSVMNVANQSLYQIWHSDELGRIQQLHRQQRWNEIPICARCVDFDWGGAVADETVDERYMAKDRGSVFMISSSGHDQRRP